MSDDLQMNASPFSSTKSHSKSAAIGTTLATEEFLDEMLSCTIVEKALGGEMLAMRLLVQSQRRRRIAFELPPINTVADARTASDALIAAYAKGTISAAEANQMSRTIS